MSQHPERARDYLEHILEALERIAQYTANKSAQEFTASTLIQDGVLRNVTILGEAARRLMTEAPDFVTTHPEIPLAQISATRNRITHGYEEVDLAVVWNMVKFDVPELKSKIASALEEISQGDQHGRT